MRKFVLFFVMMILVGGNVFGQEGTFIFPVKSDEVIDILDNIESPLSSSGGWYVNNYFGANWNDIFGCCSPGGVNYPYHPGIDYNRYDGEENAGNDVPVYSIGYGTVIRASYSDLIGWTILVRYDLSDEEDLSGYIIPGTISTNDINSASSVVAMYLHLNNNELGLIAGDHRPPVPAMVVEKGQLLGYIDSGFAHLHFEIRAGDDDRTANHNTPPQNGGYYNSQQAITNFGNIDPELFIASHVGATNQSLVGRFADGTTSQAFVDKYQELLNEGHNLGDPWDNGPGGVYVHEVNGMLIQDFRDRRDEGGESNGYYHPYTALIKGTNGVCLLKEGFWDFWMNDDGWYKYGAPISDEHKDNNGIVTQPFRKINSPNPYDYYLKWNPHNQTLLMHEAGGGATSVASVTVVDDSVAKSARQKSSGDEVIYHSDREVAELGQPIDLVQGASYDGFYTQSSSIGQFTAIADMAIDMNGQELVPTSEIVSTLNTPGYVEDVAVQGDYLYIADDCRGLQIVSVADPNNPYIVQTVRTVDCAKGVEVVGSYAYVGVDRRGLQIIDISNPGSCHIVGWVNASGRSRGVCVVGNYAYVAAHDAGLHIINISDVTNPWIEGTYNTNGHAWDVDVIGGYAYVADWYHGLQVIDIRNKHHPVRDGWLETPGYAAAIEVVGDYAYIADHYSGLHIVDIRDVRNLEAIGSFDLPGYAYGLKIYGSYAYVTDTRRGFNIIDIKDPSSPFLVRAEDTAGSCAEGIAVTSHYAYVGIGWPGMTVVKTQAEVSKQRHDTQPDLMTGLAQVHPNPFNPSTNINFSLDKNQSVKIAIYDVSGRRVAQLVDQILDAGAHSVSWLGKDQSGQGVSAGIYFVRMKTEQGMEVKKITLLK